MTKFSRIFTFIFIIFSSLLVVAQEETSAEGIKFTNETWDVILKQAKKQKKLIFVDAYTTWCRPCKMMATTTFTDKEVGNYFNEHFISVQIDMEKEPGIEFQKTYPVSAYPTIFFIDKNGKVIKKSVGALGAEEILTIAKLAVDPTSAETYKLKQKYDKGDKSYELMTKYLEAAMKESIDADTSIVNAYLNQTPKDSLFNEMPFSVFYFFVKRLDDKHAIYFAENYDYVSQIWGSNAANKANELINDGVMAVIEGKEENQYVYDFIKIITAGNEEEYNKFKTSIDEFIEKNSKN